MNQIISTWKGFTPTKVNKKRAVSQDSITYANLIWNAENAGLRSDAKFSTYIKGVHKSRKASKAALKKTIQSFEGNSSKRDVRKLLNEDIEI